MGTALSGDDLCSSSCAYSSFPFPDGPAVSGFGATLAAAQTSSLERFPRQIRIGGHFEFAAGRAVI